MAPKLPDRGADRLRRATLLAAVAVATLSVLLWAWLPGEEPLPPPVQAGSVATQPGIAPGQPATVPSLAEPAEPRAAQPSPPSAPGLSPAPPPAAPGTPPSAPSVGAPGAQPSPPPATAPTVLALPHLPRPERPVAVPPPLVSEAELAATLPTVPTMLRLRENPRIFVLLYPTLEEQGAGLNRLAALIEKAGLPRDRLLDDVELARAIHVSGDTPATWYLGHDYQGTDLARFFALAERDRVALNQSESWVRDRFREARALVPAEEEVALISTANPDHRMDPAMRAAILRHEIGHGHFFTRPDFAAHVIRVWRERFRESDRRAFREFLAREGYDATNETLMANEAMAYLIFTPDLRFFAPHHVGMTEADIARLRDAMRTGMPAH